VIAAGRQYCRFNAAKPAWGAPNRLPAAPNNSAAAAITIAALLVIRDTRAQSPRMGHDLSGRVDEELK
jgi:hypothetical protein